LRLGDRWKKTDNWNEKSGLQKRLILINTTIEEKKTISVGQGCGIVEKKTNQVPSFGQGRGSRREFCWLGGGEKQVGGKNWGSKENLSTHLPSHSRWGSRVLVCNEIKSERRGGARNVISSTGGVKTRRSPEWGNR